MRSAFRLFSALPILVLVVATSARCAEAPGDPMGDAALLQAELANARRELATLRERLNLDGQMLTGLMDALKERDGPLLKATQEIARLKADLEAANAFLTRLKIKHPKIHEEIDKSLSSPMPIRAKVTGVDRQLGLVIISKGQRDGVRKGDLVEVFRDNKRVVRVSVDDVFPDMSMCHYDPKTTEGAVEVGDDATTPQEDNEKPRKDDDKPPK